MVTMDHRQEVIHVGTWSISVSSDDLE